MLVFRDDEQSCLDLVLALCAYILSSAHNRNSFRSVLKK